ncbi:DUF6415 family natural product biosynthesis protein [Streptomyces viridosporus]|uniref:DUF6415 family natural product biosynthesis protein n=1 Tax=Streptomyces viridosporus TaxID=67581 RepID=UPI0036FE1E66
MTSSRALQPVKVETGPSARTSSTPQTAPVDIVTMRDTVNRLLDPDAVPEALPPADDELETLTATMRGHIEVLAPEVEAAARSLKAGSTRRYTTLGCVWEARSRLEAQPSPRYGGAPGYARRLARALNALCDHYEALAGATQRTGP